MNLFQLGTFKSHAGIPLPWKIECDALTNEDWDCLAYMIMQKQPPFSKVVGIPRGGIPLQNALQKYESFGGFPALVVDDIYTTGKSFKDYCDEHYANQFVFKWCVFARKAPSSDVRALFTLN